MTDHEPYTWTPPPPDPLWKRARDWLAQAVGVAIGVVVMGGLFFAQCVLPFIGDNDEEWTCADEEVAEYCGDPYTLGGFVAAVCGRDAIRFKGTLIESVTLGGDAGQGEPDDVRLEMHCDGVDLAWEAPENEWGDFESADDLPAQNDQSELAVRLAQQYAEGDINLDTAREILVDD